MDKNNLFVLGVAFVAILLLVLSVPYVVLPLLAGSV